MRTHAGGLAWREDLLYVADTKGGLRLFDLRRFAGATLPQAGWYRATGAEQRFSYASVDEAAGALLVGEYLDKLPGARLVRWPFAPRRAARPGGGGQRVGDRATRTSRAPSWPAAGC